MKRLGVLWYSTFRLAIAEMISFAVAGIAFRVIPASWQARFPSFAVDILGFGFVVTLCISIAVIVWGYLRLALGLLPNILQNFEG